MRTSQFRQRIKVFCKALNRKKEAEWVHFEFNEGDGQFVINAVRHNYDVDGLGHEFDPFCIVPKNCCCQYAQFFGVYIGDSIILSWDSPIYGEFSITAGIGIPRNCTWLFKFFSDLKEYAKTPLEEREEVE